MVEKRSIPSKLDSEVIEALDDLGKKEDRSRSWLIKQFIREGLEKRGYKIPPKNTDK